MILRDGIVLLEYADLVGENAMTQSAYDTAVRRKQLPVVQRGGNGRQVLVDWASLPEKYKAMVRQHLGADPAELAHTTTIERHLVLRPEDERYIDEFRGSNGLMLAAERRQALKNAAKVLAFLAELAERHRTLGEAAPRTYGFTSVLKLKAVVLQYIKAKRLDLPGSFPRLEAKKRAYLQAIAEGEPGASVLVHGGQGNANSARMVDPMQKATLETLASRHQNLSKRRIASDYNVIAKAQGWPTLTANTVARYIGQGDVSRSVTFFAKGAAAYQEKHGIVVRRSRPTQPTYMWVHDATTYELYYQKADHRGRITYHNRKQVCVVLDAHSWYPVGYAIGETDNIELTQEAVRNAVSHMRDLAGVYALPYQVQSDRLGHKALEAWYQPMGITYTPAKARNARAKVIEPYFAAHHRDYVQPYAPNWSGHNITAKNQPNPDALERLKKQFPNEVDVVDQIHEAFARERDAKREAFLLALNSMQEGLLRTITRSRYLELFGVQHDWENELTNRGLCPRLLGEERIYNLLDHDLQQYVGTGFRVTYDPYDLTTVLAVARQGTLRFLLPCVQHIPMALQDHTPETRALLAKVEGFKRELGQQAIDRRASNAEQVRLMASRLLEGAAIPVDLSEPKERSLGIGPNEEAAVRSYATEAGSHKTALGNARERDRVKLTPEQRAEQSF